MVSGRSRTRPPRTPAGRVACESYCRSRTKSRRAKMDTRAVMDHQYEAFAAGSADEIVKDFADDAVLIRADAVFEGRAAIHGAYQEMFAGRFKPGTYDLTV